MIEVFVVLAVLALVAVVLLPVLAKHKYRTKRNTCISNLGQIAVAFRMWANDHHERFPWHVSRNEGGSLEWTAATDIYRHFLAASSQLGNPRVLSCPTDIHRWRALEWESLSNKNISYFIALDANETTPDGLLAGDRFVSTNNQILSGIVVVTNSQMLQWLNDGHLKAGNAAMTDGSVVALTTDSLRTAFSNRTVRLAIP
jgi:hypothetical protein